MHQPDIKSKMVVILYTQKKKQKKNHWKIRKTLKTTFWC